MKEISIIALLVIILMIVMKRRSNFAPPKMPTTKLSCNPPAYLQSNMCFKKSGGGFPLPVGMPIKVQVCDAGYILKNGLCIPAPKTLKDAVRGGAAAQKTVEDAVRGGAAAPPRPAPAAAAEAARQAAAEDARVINRSLQQNALPARAITKQEWDSLWRDAARDRARYG